MLHGAPLACRLQGIIVSPLLAKELFIDDFCKTGECKKWSIWTISDRLALQKMFILWISRTLTVVPVRGNQSHVRRVVYSF